MTPRLLLVMENERVRSAIRNSRYIGKHFHRILATGLDTALEMLRDRTRTVSVMVTDRLSDEFNQRFSTLEIQPALIIFGDEPISPDRTIPRASDISDLEDLLRAELARTA